MGGRMKDETGTRQRIILAALDILNIDGISSITTRRIAEKASVNSAAMNYHFGTKENLIDYILDSTLEHTFNEWKMILEIKELDFPVRIYCLLDFTMDVISKYPGITRSQLFDPQAKDKAKNAFAENISSLLDILSDGLDERIPQSKEDLRLSLGQIFLSALSAAMIPELFATITGDDISASHARSHFIRHILKRFLGLEIAMTDIIRSNIAQVRTHAFGID